MGNRALYKAQYISKDLTTTALRDVRMIDAIIRKDVESIIGDVEEDFFVNKSVLITGGAGFLGSWMCEALIGLGAKVTCLDNLSTGKSENIDHLLKLDRFRFIQDRVETFETKDDFDYILHFASRASPEEYQLHPIETLLSNSVGSHRMLELARNLDATILFSSTSEVYGDAKIIPTPETYWGNVNPIGVRSCYDEGKRFSEALFSAYHRKYDLDTRILRIFNTYGPRLRGEGVYGRVVSRFILNSLVGEDLPVHGDGSQTRSFCYVSDKIRGVLAMLLSEEAKGEVINIGIPRELSILELANIVKKVTESRSKITFHPLPEDDPKRRCPNIEKAQQILGWEPTVDIESGIRKTAQWFKFAMSMR